MSEIDPLNAPSEFSLRIGDLFGQAVKEAVDDLHSKGIPSCTLRDGKVVYDYPPDPVRVPTDVLERMAQNGRHPEANVAWTELSSRQAAGEAVACVRHGRPMWVIPEEGVDRWLAHRRGEPFPFPSVMIPRPLPTLSILGPQCPHCGNQIHFDDGGFPNDEDWSHAITCEECGQPYRWRARISVEYVTEAVDGPA